MGDTRQIDEAPVTIADYYRKLLSPITSGRLLSADYALDDCPDQGPAHIMVT